MKQTLTVGIVGHGYVGKAFHKFFTEAKVYDPAYPESNTKEDINKCDLAIVAVPTPMKKDGSCDTSIVEESIKWLKTPVILIKSTVVPGTTEMLKKKYKKRIVFSPEYVGESKYWTPYNSTIENEPFMVVGGDRKDTNYVLRFFKPKGGPMKRYLQTDATTAELTKYIENTFYAVKVTFCNEFFEIAKTFGVDYNELRELWTADPRLSPMHTLVFEDDRGFGGKCFPKDVNAIVKATEKAGYSPKLIKEVLATNKRFRGNRD